MMQRESGRERIMHSGAAMHTGIVLSTMLSTLIAVAALSARPQPPSPQGRDKHPPAIVGLILNGEMYPVRIDAAWLAEKE